MQANILWTGIEYHSIENCVVDATIEGSVIRSTIIGAYEGKIYQVEYRIHTNKNWETLFVELNARHSDRRQQILLEGDGKGNWMMNGKPAAAFNGCIDVDIPLTPFTIHYPSTGSGYGRAMSSRSV